MAHQSPFTEPAESRLPEPARTPVADVPDLPGCESFPLAVDEIERHDDRIEYWNARAGMAWRVRDVSSWHEQPGQRLAMLAARMASVRGAAVECFGSTSLARLDAAGRPHQILQADNVAYLQPARWKTRGCVNVDEGPLPDVVLEVDHTTDVRRWKLGKYQEWGFPEIWMLVPSTRSVTRAGTRDSPAKRRRRLSAGGRERGVSGLDGGGDFPRADRGAVVGGGVAGTGTRGAGAGRARRHKARRRPVDPFPAGDSREEGRGEGSCEGRCLGATGPRHRHPRGHRVRRGPAGRTFLRNRDGHRNGVLGRCRLPAAHPLGGSVGCCS